MKTDIDDKVTPVSGDAENAPRSFSYKGGDVELNSPVETPDKKTKFQVYALNQSGDVVSVRFNGGATAIQSDDKSTPAYWNEKMSGVKSQSFKHTAFFDMASKTIRSVRDGVQEYMGVEIGLEPHDKIFTIYRSPETIAEVASKLDGLPITNDHVDVDSIGEVKQDDIVGTVKGSEVIEFEDDATDSSLYLENPVALSNEAIKLKDSGKKEFSLGYNAKLKPHDEYDFEQYAFDPTHLALVDSARGGSVLTFVDKKVNHMKKKTFLDAEGQPNLQEIVETLQAIPEAAKKLPNDKLQEFLPMLQEIAAAGGMSIEAVEEEIEPESTEDADIEKDEAEAVEMDKDFEDMEADEKEKFEDSKLFKSIIASTKKGFKDSKAFKDALDTGIKAHAVVMEKAMQFVDDQYVFSGKTTKQIMTDAIAVEYGDKTFEDSKLDVAFDMLKRSGSSLQNFGDSSNELTPLEQRINDGED